MPQTVKKCRVLVLSIGYIPHKTPSDKQFVHELLGSLGDDIQIAIWSLNDATKSPRRIVRNELNATYINENRVFHKPLFPDQAGAYKAHPLHSNLRNAVEISASLITHAGSIHRMIRNFKPDVIHFTDSFGPIGRLLKFSNRKIPFTITKPTMQVRGSGSKWLYQAYTRFSLSHAQCIVSFTGAAREQLSNLGIPNDVSKVIPWGVFTPKKFISTETLNSIRQRYNVSEHGKLIVVTDRMFGQDMLDFIEALNKLDKPDSIKFVLAIRPTRFSPELKKLSTSQVIIESGPSDFYELLEAADALLSPPSPHGSNHTSLLPLTWLEAMIRKTPIITTPAPGVGDVVKDQETGLLYKNNEDLTKILYRLRNFDVADRCGTNAAQLVNSRFLIPFIAKQYSEMWKDLSQRNDRTQEC